MLKVFKDLFDREELLAGSFGIEREALRVSENGKLAVTNHPELFGSKMTNPYITTDFSESQVEMITPALPTTKEAYDFLSSLYDMVALNIGEEYLWPQSMPCNIPEDKDIPIAKYEDCEVCKKAREYREELFKKYGGKKQLISGIHFNFSFDEQMIHKLYEAQNSTMSYQHFKDSVYLKVARNYLKYRWLMIYLIGAAPVIHKSYAKDCTKHLSQVGPYSFSNEGAISYRNGECGYRNEVDLYPDYTTVEHYIESINSFVEEGSLQSYKELYSQIRPKAKDNTNLLESLQKEGIQYIEVRSIDINPFDKGGITLEDLDFIHIFMLYLLIKEEEQDLNSEKLQKEATENQRMIAKCGLEDVWLSHNGVKVKKSTWALEILHDMLQMSKELELNYEGVIESALAKVLDPKFTYAYRITALDKEKTYVGAHVELAKIYKEAAYKHRYKLYGYEDLELSTQILMKEAMSRGITVNVLDREDNFIELKKGGHVEYVKQATKTSKDSYITMLMMENKTVTKKVLERNHVKVPKGIEVVKGQSLQAALRKYEHQPIVVKPKSTNFGTGISIFPEGATKEDIVRALEIGFEHDNTVLIEEFAKGKEYRFLVIGDEVVGILHRVPANVEGDGKLSIRELVAIKNQDSLRGTGYKTPLEKIKLDASSELFLKQRGLNFEDVPQKGEIVYLRENSNISTGGDSIDYTDLIPQRFKQIAVDAAKAVEAKFCGVDMMLEDYSNEEGTYAIIELNFNPAIHIHSFPYKGTERNIAKHILDVLGFLGEEKCGK